MPGHKRVLKKLNIFVGLMSQRKKSEVLRDKERECEKEKDLVFWDLGSEEK